MAASSDWRKVLNEHDIFRYLRKNYESDSHDFSVSNLIHVRDGELYVWSPHDSQLLTVNLKTLSHSIALDDNEGKHVNNKDATIFQQLLCTDSPRHVVSSLSFSETGSHVALVGREGISVLQLPHRWGKNALFEGGKEKILCKTFSVAERFFRTSGEKLLQAAWHPGSSSDSHLVLLTSDNSFRIYDLRDPQNAIETYPLQEGNGSYGQSPSKIGVDMALGETAVAFDFGAPVELLPFQQPGFEEEPGSESEQPLAWPLYLLYGNGTIYTVTTCLHLKYAVCSKLQGPLSMYPPAEDNYGTDACSVLCLPCQPPVLVVATCEGHLHHCLVLNSGDEDGTQDRLTRNTQKAFPTFKPLPLPRLYVYETVEVEFSLTTVSLETDEALEDDYTCPIKLHPDGSSTDRYHCSHNAGVHTVALPWVHRLQQFCSAEDMSLPALGPSHQAIVEHLVCTKPSPSSSACPIIGVAVSTEHLLGPPTLLCLTSSLRLLAFPLLNIYRTPSVSMLDGAPKQSIPSPLRQLRHEPFDQYIQKLLHRNSSVPRLDQQGEKDTPCPQECFQLLSRITQVFREEYIQKQHLARAEIEKRVRLLKEQKLWQQEDLQMTQQAKNILTDGAHGLADKLENAKYNHQHLIHRVETVLKKLQERVPLLTEAERIMHKELTDIQTSLAKHTASIQQLQIKQEYQHRQITHAARSHKHASPVFSKGQTQQLRSALKREGDEIGGLVHQISQLRTNVET